MTAGRGRHAEIAGAGFAGLAAAIALAQRGWTVRVHERRSLVDAEGFGISVHRNGIRVLQALGVLEHVQPHSMRVRYLDRYDAHGRRVARVRAEHSLRTSRHHLISQLLLRARQLGVDVQTSSPAAAAEPSGALILEDGRRLAADLVIGCDGYASRVRDSLGLLASRTLLRDCGARIMIPAAPGDPVRESPDGTSSSEYWSGTRRMLLTPCVGDQLYVGMSCLDSDAAAKKTPIEPAVWKSSFPMLADVIDRGAEHGDWEHAMFVRFQVIRLRRWSAGRVAILGDAANAMPPNLGQGTGIAMMNALALAVTLDEQPDVPQALDLWEQRERPLTDHTQRWSRMYSATTHWPGTLRSLAMTATSRIGWLRERYQRTANAMPRGCT